MKKILLIPALLFNFIFAASDEQIINFYKKFTPPDAKITIKSKNKLKDFKGFEAIFVNIESQQGNGSDIIFSKDNLLFTEIIDIDTGLSARKEIDLIINKDRDKELGKIYKNEDKKNIVFLGNDPKKNTLVVFTDPECPACRAELTRIEDRLKENNLQLILTPVHGPSALEKSYLILQKTAQAKNDEEKIKIIKKYYDKDVKITEKVSQKDVDNLDTLRKKYFKAGLKGVPLVVDINNLELK